MWKILIFLVKIYQNLFSPDHSFWAKWLNKPPYCKHFPSCSNYMIKSIENRGALKWLIDGLKRILKCNPWNKWWIDLPKWTSKIVFISWNEWVWKTTIVKKIQDIWDNNAFFYWEECVKLFREIYPGTEKFSRLSILEREIIIEKVNRKLNDLIKNSNTRFLFIDWHNILYQDWQFIESLDDSFYDKISYFILLQNNFKVVKSRVKYSQKIRTDAAKSDFLFHKKWLLEEIRVKHLSKVFNIPYYIVENIDIDDTIHKIFKFIK